MYYYTYKAVLTHILHKFYRTRPIRPGINVNGFPPRGVVDVTNGEISNTLGYVLQHLVVNIQAINTVNCQHSEWHPSYVIECVCDDLSR